MKYCANEVRSRFSTAGRGLAACTLAVGLTIASGGMVPASEDGAGADAVASASITDTDTAAAAATADATPDDTDGSQASGKDAASVNDQAASDQAAAEQAAAEQAAAEQAAAEQAAAEQAAAEQAAAEQAAADTAAAALAIQPRPLSVAPMNQPIYPADRPSWIDGSPDLENDPVVWPVKSLLRSSPEEAAESLNVQVRGALEAYAEHLLGPEAASQLAGHAMLSLESDWVTQADRYRGQAERGQETVYEEAVLLRIDDRLNRRLRTAWKEHQTSERLGVVGAVSGASLCLLLAGTGVMRRISRKAAT
jgi:flagellar biosynthesis GTPase FlhF